MRRIKTLARKHGFNCKMDKKRGKGSHVTLYYKNKRTIVRNPKEELKKGTLNAMLKQPELNHKDIQDI